MATLTVIVRDRSGIVFSGDAQAVSSINEKGPFDILSGHEHFISLIKTSVDIHLPDGKKSYGLTSGMISVINDEVTILLGVLSK